MDAHIVPIRTAVIIFFFLSFFLSVPWLIYNYRKYGYFSLWHSIVIYSFLFYSLSALFLVVLPLPLTRDTCALQPADTVHYVLVPFAFMSTLLSDVSISLSSPSSWVNFFKHPAFFEVFFNGILLFPLGVYLRYFSGQIKFWKKALLIAFSTSLFFEITQLTGIYGLYNCAYRLFDANDLIFNTLGAMIGFFMAPIILACFPRKESVLHKAEKRKNKITYFRIALAVIADLLLIQIIMTLFTSWLSNNILLGILLNFVLFIVFFLLIPALWQGKTVGSALLKFKLVNVSGQQLNLLQLVKRTFAIYLPFLFIDLVKLINITEFEMGSAFYVYQALITVVLFGIISIIIITLCLHFIIVVMFKKQGFYFDRFSKTYVAKNDTAKQNHL